MSSEGFKETEIGLIPEGWKLKAFSDIVDIIGGGTPKTTMEEYWEGEIPWLSVVDFNNEFRTVNETEKSITEMGLNNSSTKILKKGELIISARGTVGAIAQLGRDMAFNQSCYGLRAMKTMTDNDFIYYLLKYSLNILKQTTHGSTFDTITKNTFDLLKVPLPPMKEQIKIASILSVLDDKIELNHRMNQTLEAIGQAIFRHWFVHFEFPNSEGQPYRSSGGEMVDSELGEIPKGWEIGKFGKIVDNFDKKRIPLSKKQRKSRKGQYPYYGATSIMDYVDDFLFNGTYVLMAEDGSVMDDDEKPVLQYVWGKFWVNNHAHVLKGKNGISDEFVYLLLKNTNIKHLVTGAVQLKINQKNMNSLQVVIPDLDILSKFSEIIKPIFAKYMAYSDENKTLSQLRDSLLPKLMSGKIRANIPEEATVK